ncbi:hypothetical protein WR25_03410 [Diploscapter pachys]|uniref:Uncharacterized protein n=1 Tax=Diploscapter pachys TaxID=2018661 RepID=A0A2A2LU38_9BILA|nr:hypothetical protein WR25_03410 [Diploscapter pachys]
MGSFSSIEESFRRAVGLRRGTKSSRRQDSYSCAAREKCRRRKEEGEGEGRRSRETKGKKHSRKWLSLAEIVQQIKREQESVKIAQAREQEEWRKTMGERTDETLA